MKGSKLYIVFIMVTMFLTGCNPDNVDNVTFDVSIADCTNQIHTGREVTFLFEGNPDYITFYSGENGNSYANKDRTTVTLNSLTLEASFKQQYTDKEYYNKELIHVYISEDFSGNYTVEGIKIVIGQKFQGRKQDNSSYLLLLPVHQ